MPAADRFVERPVKYRLRSCVGCGRSTCFPWRDFSIETSWAPNIAASEIRKRIGKRRLFGGGDTPFVGKAVGDTEFHFSRRIRYSNSALPVIRAIVEPSPYGGAWVRIRMRLHMAVAAFMTVWMTGATLGCVSGLVALAHGHRGGLGGLAMPVFGIGLIMIPFAIEARIAERLLRELFPAVPGPPPPPNHFSSVDRSP